jgi:hypothetical protein
MGEAAAAAALSAAEAQTRRLLEYDRSSAKRTTVIDDQTEWCAIHGEESHGLLEGTLGATEISVQCVVAAHASSPLD